jgi:hypothetical protein
MSQCIEKVETIQRGLFDVEFKPKKQKCKRKVGDEWLDVLSYNTGMSYQTAQWHRQKNREKKLRAEGKVLCDCGKPIVPRTGDIRRGKCYDCLHPNFRKVD